MTNLSEVDYCIIVTNDHETPHVKNHINRLRELYGVGPNIHIVDKGTSDNRTRFYKKFSITVHRPTIPKQDCRSGYDVTSPYGFDVANSYDWAVNNCGGSKWCAVAHPDLFYIRADYLQFYLLSISEEVGVIGTCNSLIFINRQAYKQLPIKFTPLLGARVVRRKQIDNGRETYTLHYSSDPRESYGEVTLIGPDVGELLILMMQALGWSYIPPPDHLHTSIHHAGGGSKYEVSRSTGLILQPQVRRGKVQCEIHSEDKPGLDCSFCAAAAGLLRTV